MLCNHLGVGKMKSIFSLCVCACMCCSACVSCMHRCTDWLVSHPNCSLFTLRLQAILFVAFGNKYWCVIISRSSTSFNSPVITSTPVCTSLSNYNSDLSREFAVWQTCLWGFIEGIASWFNCATESWTVTPRKHECSRATPVWQPTLIITCDNLAPLYFSKIYW